MPRSLRPMTYGNDFRPTKGLFFSDTLFSLHSFYMRTFSSVRFFILLATALFFGTLLPRVAQWPMLYWFVTLPGTVLHEFMHFFTALLLQGSPSGFSVWPTWDAHGEMQTMGHVLFHANWYNAAFVGLAPLMLAPFGVAFLYLASICSWRTALFFFYCAVCAWASLVPSPQDFSIAFNHFFSLLFWLIGVLLLGFLAWHFRSKILKFFLDTRRF
jgi:hypothetical protein